MTLSELSVVANVVTAFSAVAVAYFVYEWTRQTDRNSISSQLNEGWQQFNAVVLSDPDLLKIDAGNHPFGNLTDYESKKLYFYFMWLNVADNTVRAKNKGLVDDDLADARLDNQARQTIGDRDFLEQHVFPRGYEETAVVSELRRRWREFENPKG